MKFIILFLITCSSPYYILIINISDISNLSSVELLHISNSQFSSVHFSPVPVSISCRSIFFDNVFRFVQMSSGKNICGQKGHTGDLKKATTNSVGGQKNHTADGGQKNHTTDRHGKRQMQLQRRWSLCK